MEIDVYSVYKRIGKANHKDNLVVCRPAVKLSIRQLVDSVETNRPYEVMYLVYHENISDMIDLDVYEKYATATKELFNKDPRHFGVLCYKNKQGRLSFK